MYIRMKLDDRGINRVLDSIVFEEDNIDILNVCKEFKRYREFLIKVSIFFFLILYFILTGVTVVLEIEVSFVVTTILLGITFIATYLQWVVCKRIYWKVKSNKLGRLKEVMGIKRGYYVSLVDFNGRVYIVGDSVESDFLGRFEEPFEDYGTQVDPERVSLVSYEVDHFDVYRVIEQ